MVTTKRTTLKRTAEPKEERTISRTVKAPEPEKPNLEALKSKLEQRRLRTEEHKKQEPPPSKPVSEGPAGVITDALVNPTSEKIIEFTDLDRNQVTLIPTLRVIDAAWEYCQEVATFRGDSSVYVKQYEKDEPVMGNLIEKFIFTLAQCRRSLGGKTQKALEDLALADLETRNNEDDMGGLGGGHGFEE